MVVRARAYPHKERQVEFIGKFYRASGGLFIAERRNPIGKELLWDYVRKDLRIPVSIGTQVTDFVRFLFGNPCARNRVSILGCVGLGLFRPPNRACNLMFRLAGAPGISGLQARCECRGTALA